MELVRAMLMSLLLKLVTRGIVMLMGVMLKQLKAAALGGSRVMQLLVTSNRARRLR